MVFATHSGKQIYPARVATASNRLEVEFLRSADLIIALNQSGNVIKQGTPEKLNLGESYIRSLSIVKMNTSIYMEKNELEAILSTPKIFLNVDQTKAPDLLSESSRRNGDFTVYKYYLSTIGIWNFWIFLFSVTAFAFFYVFPSKLPHLHCFFLA